MSEMPNKVVCTLVPRTDERFWTDAGCFVDTGGSVAVDVEYTKSSVVKAIAADRDRLAARVAELEAELKAAVEYQRALMFHEDSDRDPMTPDGRTPQWWVDAVLSEASKEADRGE